MRAAWAAPRAANVRPAGALRARNSTMRPPKIKTPAMMWNQSNAPSRPEVSNNTRHRSPGEGLGIRPRALDLDDSEVVKKSAALAISRSGGARNPRVFQHTLRFLRSDETRPPFRSRRIIFSQHLGPGGPGAPSPPTMPRDKPGNASRSDVPASSALSPTMRRSMPCGWRSRTGDCAATRPRPVRSRSTRP